MANLMTPELRLNPFPMYSMMREQAPVLYDPNFGVWLVFGYHDVRTVLTDHERFSSEHAKARESSDRVIMSSIISLDPPRHTQLRGLISKAFTPKAIADLEPLVAAIVAELLDRAVGQEQVDLIDELAIPLPVRVIAAMLGIPAADQARFKRWSDAVVISADTFITNQEDPAVTAEINEMHDYFRAITAQRRQAPGNDLISKLLAVEVDGEQLTEQDILAFCWLLLVGGNETTTSLIGNAVLTLLEHPEALADLRAHPELMPQAVEEVLRFRSPAQMMFRIARVDLELGGHKIEAGQRVIPFIGSANRDPAVFADPDRFDIRRDPNPHVAFGHGIHFCLGAPLARLEARVALTALLARFSQIERVDSEPLEPMRGMLVHGVAHLPVRLRP